MPDAAVRSACHAAGPIVRHHNIMANLVLYLTAARTCVGLPRIGSTDPNGVSRSSRREPSFWSKRHDRREVSADHSGETQSAAPARQQHCRPQQPGAVGDLHGASPKGAAWCSGFSRPPATCWTRRQRRPSCISPHRRAVRAPHRCGVSAAGGGVVAAGGECGQKRRDGASSPANRPRQSHGANEATRPHCFLTRSEHSGQASESPMLSWLGPSCRVPREIESERIR